MTPQRLKQRRRILNARAVSERIAAADHAAAMLARADAAALAEKLAREVGLSAAGTGRTNGALLAARAALSDRLNAAVVSMAVRESALSAGEKLAASRAIAARLARRSAETLVERAETAVSAASERRLTLPPRRLPERRA
jgi:hypothetical protein